MGDGRSELREEGAGTRGDGAGGLEDEGEELSAFTSRELGEFTSL